LHCSLENPVKTRRRRFIAAKASAVYFCLLILCTPVTGSASDGDAEPADKAATATKHTTEKADVKHEDILDRAFSPLDKAVSDINRDINKGDNSEAPASESSKPAPAQ
jgi:uncharacterized protein with LGFP repeats